MSNPFAVPIRKPLNQPTPGDLLCPVCGKCQRDPGQWRVCVNCDESLTGWDDAPVEVFKQFTNAKVWPSPVAGRA